MTTTIQQTHQALIKELRVNADTFVQLTDGVSAFCGVLTNDKNTFFPFYCIESDEKAAPTFEEDAHYRYSKLENYVWNDDRDTDDIRAEFITHVANGGEYTTNHDLFEAVMTNLTTADKIA